jgi:hypothetical protein
MSCRHIDYIKLDCMHHGQLIMVQVLKPYHANMHLSGRDSPKTMSKSSSVDGPCAVLTIRCVVPTGAKGWSIGTDVHPPLHTIRPRTCASALNFITTEIRHAYPTCVASCLEI